MSHSQIAGHSESLLLGSFLSKGTRYKETKVIGLLVGWRISCPISEVKALRLKSSRRPPHDKKDHCNFPRSSSREIHLYENCREFLSWRSSPLSSKISRLMSFLLNSFKCSFYHGMSRDLLGIRVVLFSQLKYFFWKNIIEALFLRSHVRVFLAWGEVVCFVEKLWFAWLRQINLACANITKTWPAQLAFTRQTTPNWSYRVPT